MVFIFRNKDEGVSDLQDLTMSFSGLGEKVLEHYTFAKVLVSLRMISLRVTNGTENFREFYMYSGKFDQNSCHKLFAGLWYSVGISTSSKSKEISA